MQCLKCQHKNKPSAKYCSHCGTKFEQVCPQCGAQVDPTDRFCSECSTALDTSVTSEPEKTDSTSGPLSYTPPHLAERILSKRTVIEGERRTITVLFADAKGFTPISENLGDETIYDLSKEFVSLMMDAVHRYEGTINQFRGDGILALFGAPIAHEDAARRAVAAAIEMQNTLKEYATKIKPKHGIDLQFRIGLNTGPVVVGKVHDNLEMDYTAYGDTMNLGARMEEMAAPGSVYLSENTYSAVADYFECESLGSLTVKGKESPVMVYKALRPKPAKTRLEAATERGLSPFVGRHHELTVLLEYIEKVKRGKGQVMLISSEAGTGKSRLLLEFQKAINDQEVKWLEGRCISFGQNISYIPFIDIIRHTFNVEEDDNNDDIIGRIDKRVSDWDKPARENVPYLKYMLNVDPGNPDVLEMDPMERRARIFDSLRTILIQESREGPLVVVVEDLHWIDELSESALKALVDVVASIPVLLVLTYRPDYNHTLGERTYYNRLSLSNLLPEEGVALASGMLQVTILPEDLHQLISRKGEGNPFYIEEVINSLLESGVLQRENGTYALKQPIDQIRVPDTIQEVILSRIDRLEHQTREAIQLASVIGREFTFRLLDRISDVEVKLEERLEKLKVLELIYQKAYFPELSYMFKHALTQDVAYSTLLLERRRVLHGIIGTAIEKLYADERLPEQYEVLAYHYFEGAIWEKALEYQLKSAHKSTAAFGNQDALAYFDRALQVHKEMENPPEKMLIEIYSGRAKIYFGMSEFIKSVDNYNLLREVASSIGNRSLEGQALAGAAHSYVWAHEFVKAKSMAREALAIAEENEDDRVKTVGIYVLNFIDAITGNLKNAENKALKSVQISQKTNQPNYETWGYVWETLIHSWRGQYTQAHEFGREGTKVAERHRLGFQLVHVRWCDTLALAGHGHYKEAITIMNDSIALCERMSEKVIQSRCWNTLGWVYNELCDWERANEYNHKGLDFALTFGDSEIILNAKINLADSAFGIGNHDQARKMLEDIYASLPQEHEWMKWRITQRLTHSLGEIVFEEGNENRALDLANECLALAEPTESRKNIVKGQRLRGQVFLAQGKLKEAEKEFLKALNIAEQIGNPPQLWKTFVAMGDLRQAQKRKNDALDAYHNALSVIEKVAAGLDDKSLKNTFLNSEHVKSIIKKAEK